MDPDACVNRLLEALGDRSREEAEEAADDLNEWLEKGGFEPRRSAEVEITQALVAADLADGECPAVDDLLTRLRGE